MFEAHVLGMLKGMLYGVILLLLLWAVAEVVGWSIRLRRAHEVAARLRVERPLGRIHTSRTQTETGGHVDEKRAA